MGMKLARAEGALFAYLLSGGRFACWILMLTGAGLLGLGTFYLAASAYAAGIAAITGAGVVICFAQAVARGVWTFIVPNIAVVLAAGALGYASFLIASGQPLFVTDKSGTMPPARAEGMDEPSYVTSGEVQLAWMRLEEGRVTYDPEPEREAIAVLLRAGESFEGRDLSFLTLTNLVLRGAPEAEDPADQEGLDLTGVQLYGARLLCTDLGSAKLTGALFDFPNGLKEGFGTEALRTRARFANFRHAKLDGARLGNTDFTYANFENADFGTADLTGATLDYVNLAGASLERTKGLTLEQLAKACIGDQTQLPPHIALDGDIQWAPQCTSAWGLVDPRESAGSVFAVVPEGRETQCGSGADVK